MIDDIIGKVLAHCQQKIGFYLSMIDINIKDKGRSQS